MFILASVGSYIIGKTDIVTDEPTRYNTFLVLKK